MAYQKVGTPRFYIDWGEWQKSLGVLDTGQMDYVNGDSGDIGEIATLEEMIGIVGLDPFNPLILSVNGLNTKGRVTFTSGAENGAEHIGFPNYIALLNHNFYSSNTKFNIQTSSTGTDNYSIDLESSIINYEDENTSFPDWGGNNGFSIAEIKNNVNPSGSKFLRLAISSGTDPDLGHTFTDDVYIGAISFGRFYDMPVNPDLDLSMSIEYDGFTNIKTLSGHTITQANYQGSPWWYDKDGNKVEPWSVGQSTGISKRNGRRVWKLKFSYMSDKDLFASNYGSSTYAEDVLPYESGDQDIPNLGANLLFYGDFNTDVSANTTPAGGRDSGTGWGTDSYTSLIDGTSTISGGLANLRQMSQADNETIEGSDEWTSSITSTAKNWRLYQNNVFKTSDTSLSESDNNRNKKIIYRVSFRAKYVDVDNAGDFLQLGAGYHRFFQQPMTSTFANYEVEFSFDDTPSDDNDLSSNFADAWNHSHAHKLTIGSYPAGDAHTTGWENHFQIEWIKVQQHNPSDFYYTIDNDDSFSAQVLNKISHGEKFIFQPDNTSNNPSDFAICVLDGDSFEMKRTAWNVYDIEMTIREVW